MKIILNNSEEAMAVVKRMVFLAYNACGRPMGMGVLQDMRLDGKSAEEEKVWQCAYNQEDYPMRHGKANEVYCDYVFGRMMKWGCEWEKNIITIPEKYFRSDYQSFCGTYPDNKALAIAALKSLKIKDTQIEDD